MTGLLDKNLMRSMCCVSARCRGFVRFLAAAIFIVGCVQLIGAHPLGNFTVNHFARIEIGIDQVKIRYVVDMAEVSTFQD